MEGPLDAELNNIIIEPDRKKAISMAIQMTTPGNFVIVAGKGQERVFD